MQIFPLLRESCGINCLSCTERHSTIIFYKSTNQQLLIGINYIVIFIITLEIKLTYAYIHIYILYIYIYHQYSVQNGKPLDFLVSFCSPDEQVGVILILNVIIIFFSCLATSSCYQVLNVTAITSSIFYRTNCSLADSLQKCRNG